MENKEQIAMSSDNSTPATNGTTNGTSNGTKNGSSVSEKLKKSQKVLGVEFAPIDVPWERRMQTLGALTWVLSGPAGFLIILPIFLLMGFSIFHPVVLLYFAWMCYDKETCHRGGRRFNFVRRLGIWKHYRDYFPVKLVKTTDLDPKRNYLFGSHPHGILCSGVFSSFCTEANDVSKVFPGFTFHVLTLNMNFWFPLTRELVMAEGLCSASKESMNYLLSYPGGGKAAVLVPGGAPESLDSHPGTYIVQMKNKKGFIKVAIRNGSPLVPVISFGETDIYYQVSNPQGSLLRRFQNKMQKMLEFAPIIFVGRGIFQYSFGLLPNRRPITVVVGAPIEVKKIDDPTQEDIDTIHSQYVDALVKLFNTHRDEYANSDAEIVIC